MAKPIPIIQCIDLEPDCRQLNPRRPLPWVGYQRSYEIFSRWRADWEEVTGSPAHFSWFFRMDPQVEQIYGSATWPVAQYPEIIQDLSRQGDEFGLHVHFFRWEPTLHRWMIDQGNPQWVEHCLRASLAAYQQAFGRKCRSYRGGDAWISQEAVTLLEQSGVAFDLTLEPGQESYRGLKRGESNSGFNPDLQHIPQTPYLPRVANFKEADPERCEGMWMIPMSRAEIFGLSALAFKIFRRLVNRVRLNRAWITLYLFQAPSLFRQVVDRILGTMENPYLLIQSHSQAVLRPYFFRNMKKNLKYLLSHPCAKDFVLSTPQEAMATLEIISGKDDVRRRA